MSTVGSFYYLTFNIPKGTQAVDTSQPLHPPPYHRYSSSSAHILSDYHTFQPERIFPAENFTGTMAVETGVERKVLKEGNGTDKPQKGDDVTIEYTGNLYDEAQADNDYRGEQ